MTKYNSVPYDKTKITGGFWSRRLDIIREATAPAVYDRFSETHRFDALSCIPSKEYEPHIFWDSDIAKWLEGAAYLLSSKRDSGLEAICDREIAKIIENRAEDGYFNSYYLTVDPGKRFTERTNHELYCAGHLIEAAIAYYNATGKRAFLDAMTEYADLIYDIFYVRQSAPFTTGGHPEIELSLFKLSAATNNEKYASLAKFFLDKRGNNDKDATRWEWGECYDQSHIPLKMQTEAKGHAVRACYVYTAMADCAAYYGDAEYAAACDALFKNITERKMYITGGIGATGGSEAFGDEYELPNVSSYAETCAAIALAYFARRMLLLRPDSRYADTVERVMYNGMLSGISLDGRKFFYSNPMEIPKGGGAERSEVFDCSCCPPNVLRFIASISESFYTYGGDTLFIHQYAESTADFQGARIAQKTSYPVSGEITIDIKGDFKFAALRIPGWCKAFSLSHPYVMKSGYAVISLSGDDTVTLKLDMSARLEKSHPAVTENKGKSTVARGPVVYCMEGADNGGDLDTLFLTEDCALEAAASDKLGVPVITVLGYRNEKLTEPAKMTFIPYFAFANRGRDQMKVWIRTVPRAE